MAMSKGPGRGFFRATLWVPSRRPRSGLVAEWQILFDTINVGGVDEGGVAQGPAALGILALKQMASARAAPQHFAGAGYLEPFGNCLPGFDPFGSSHTS